MVIGAPGEDGGTGNAYLWDASGTGGWLGRTFRPFFVDASNQMADDPADGRHFGVGASVISEGHYVVGSDPVAGSNLPQNLYSFRQRGPAWSSVGDIVAPSQLPTAKLGTSIAVDGNTAVVGAKDYDGRGAVFVYVQNTSGEWTQQARLQGSGIVGGDQFGATVAISGDTIAVGSPGSGTAATGSAFVFTRAGGRWTQQVELTNAAAGFGSTVDLDVGTIVVGAAASDTAVIYELSGNAWTATATLSGIDTFGSSVTIDGDTVAIGAPGAGASSTGAVAIYIDDDTLGWTLQGSLSHSHSSAGDEFGAAIDLSGDWLIVGAPGEAALSSTMALDAGAAYLFQRSSGNTWTARDRLRLAAGAANDHFGSAVAIDGERAIVGAWGRDRGVGDEGEAFSYGYRYGAWRLESVSEPLSGSDVEAGDQFGFTVALSGDIAMLGAPQRAGRPGSLIDTAGAGYVFLRDVSPPTTVTQPVQQDVLLEGAQANVIDGTLNGVQMSDLTFFDVQRVTLRTGNAADTVTLGEDGLVALGLRDFTVATGAGNDLLRVESTQLDPPALGSFDQAGDFGDAEEGDDVPDGAAYVAAAGAFRFAGGAGSDRVEAEFDADWRLAIDSLIANDGGELLLAGVEGATLRGGASGNVIEVAGWAGAVTIDGADGADQIRVVLAETGVAQVNDSGTHGDDRLTVLGTDAKDQIHVRAFEVVGNQVGYSGIERLVVAARGGDDEVTVTDSTAAEVYVDDGSGSDLIRVEDGTHPFTLVISDGGPAPDELVTENALTAPSGDVDTLSIEGGALGTVDVPFSAAGKTIRYDGTIETVEAMTVSPVQSLAGRAEADVIVLNGDLLTINDAGYSMTGVTDLTVDALGGDDRFVIVSIRPGMAVRLIGNGGSDTLTGPDGDRVWTLTGANAGQLDILGFEFSGIENLTGGLGVDRFVLGDGASLTGTLTDDPSGILDYSDRTSVVTIDLGTRSATDLGGLIGIGTFIGGDSGEDVFAGPTGSQTWTIGAPNAGAVGGVAFSGFENVRGGDDADDFTLQASLVGSIDGGGGADTLRASSGTGDDTATIGHGSLAVGGISAQFSHIERLIVHTGGGADTVTVNLFAGDSLAIDLDTGAQDDSVSVLGTAGGDAIAVAGSTVSGLAVTLSLAAVETLQIDAAGGDDTITATGESVTGALSLIGGAGSDAITVQQPLVAGSIAVDGGGGDADSLRVVTAGIDNDLSLDGDSVHIAGGASISYDDVDSLRIETGSGSANVATADTHAGSTTIVMGEQGDTLNVTTTTGALTVEMGGGNDTAVIAAIGATASVDLGDGDDSVAVPRLASDSSGDATDDPAIVLSGIAALLTLDGGLGTDALSASNSGDAATRSGSLTQDTLSGLGMGGSIGYGDFESLRIDLGSGADTFDVLSTHAGSTRLRGNGGADLVRILSTGGVLVVETGSGNDRVDVRAIGADATVDAGDGDDVVIVGSTDGLLEAIDGGLVVRGGLGDDAMTADDGGELLPSVGMLAATLLTGLGLAGAGIDYADLESLTVNLGGAGDTFTIEGTHAGTTLLNAGAGADTVAVYTIAGATTVDTGAGNDSINVGSPGPSTVDAIGALLTVNGNGDSDTLVVHDSGDLTADTGTLTATAISGLDMAGRIGYAALEQVTIHLGSAGDEFTIEGTHAGATTLETSSGADVVHVQATAGVTTVNAGAGADTVNVRTIGAVTTVNGGADDDTVNVGSLAPATDGTVNGIGALLNVQGEGGAADVLNVDDRGDTDANTGTLTSTMLTGLGMAAGIAYGTLETLAIGLGSAGDTFTVQSTHAGVTSVVGNGGADTFHVDAPSGSLDGVLGSLNLDAGAGSNTLRVIDTGDTTGDVIGIGAAAITGIAPGVIGYAATGGSFAGGITISAGSGGNTIAIASTHRSGGVRTITLVTTGTGSDTVTVSETVPEFLVLNAQEGSDVVDATATTTPVTIFGGAGNDTVRGGSAADVLFGDEGEVRYDDTTVLSSDAGQAFIANPGPSAARRSIGATGTAAGTDQVFGNAGADTIIGGFGADTVDGGAGSDIAIGDAGLVTLAAGVVERIETTEPLTGGADTISGGGDGDVLLGGALGDTLNGDGGADVLLGDGARLDHVAGDLQIIAIAASGIGGNDTLAGGDGDDVAIGGAGADGLAGGLGNDLLLGDEGELTLIAGVRQVATSINPMVGAADTISGDDGDDSILGGAAGDSIQGNAGADLILGDHGRLDYAAVAGAGLDVAATTDPTVGGNDAIGGGAGNDTVFGGAGSDTLNGEDGADVLFGDHGRLDLDATGPVKFLSIDTAAADGGAGDTVSGGAGDDTVIGGHGDDLLFGDADHDDLIGGHNVAGGSDTGDRIDGGTGHDVIAGDNAWVAPTTSVTSPRLRALAGPAIYDLAAQTTMAGAEGTVATLPRQRTITLLDHVAGTPAGTSGDDVIAGGAQDDLVFGQLGNDTLLGDGSLVFNAATSSWITSSVEAATDGDDYVEGNGGNDRIYGGLGQDDLVGGSSSFFGLSTRDHRQDGSDVIFGGAGTDVARNDLGDGAAATGHARDADVIVGDNASIYRLVGKNGIPTGAYLTFAYDNYSATLKLIPRAVAFLDYTPGGLDFSASAALDLGADDEVHGESGDDAIYGMTGGDALYGEGQDDDIIGGYGHDWISGGTGDDGVLGDDGRIYTSRNGTAEALYGIAATTQQTISTSGQAQLATINVTGKLKRTVNLTPFNVDPADAATFDPVLTPSDDIIFGGWGNDWLHGGAGDDAISGAEALAVSYAQRYDGTGALIGVVQIDYFHPVNPGDVLHFSATSTAGGRAGEFALYDEYDPRRMILLADAGTLSKTGAGKQFLLNFGVTGEGVSTGTTWSDGDDAIFGDLGNDWLVGGTGRDNSYGGYGNDLLNADDDHGTNGGLNSGPDTQASYEDRAVGGAGRDVLIGNVVGDRLIDWVGEFDTYLVPFTSGAGATVSRSLQPQLAEFLQALSAGDGADPTRAADTGADPARNGEPEGELGLLRQSDFDWGAQTGGPIDPQLGNVPSGSREVKSSANFNDGKMQGFLTDSGVWSVSKGALQVSAESIGGDAVSVFQTGEELPAYFEVQASISVIKPTSGWKANAYLIFDYQSKTDFKFSGIDIASNKLVMGHRNASGWIVDEQTPFQAKPDTFYNMTLASNGLVASLIVNSATVFSHAYAPRVIDGWSYGLNYGLVGVGSDNSRGSLDNLAVQVLPPQVTFQATEPFTSSAGSLFSGQTTGLWALQSGRYVGTPAVGGDTAISLMQLGDVPALGLNSWLSLETKLSTSTRAGIAFDYYSPTDFKYVMVDTVADQVIVGHRAANGWFTDAAATRTIDAGVDVRLGIDLRGSGVTVRLIQTVMVNGQPTDKVDAVVGHVFNGVTLDGKFGLIARSGAASFDAATVKTNDQAFSTANALLAGSAPDTTVAASHGPDRAEIEALLAEATRRWSLLGGDAEEAAAGSFGLQVTVTNLPGLRLAEYVNGNLLVDVDAAGYGWFVDSTPADDSEFAAQDGVMSATVGAARGRMDLLTAVAHEVGHARGLTHADEGVMADRLASGIRLVRFDVDDEAEAVGAVTRPAHVIDFDVADRPMSYEARAASAVGAPAARSTAPVAPISRPLIDWFGKTIEAAASGLRQSPAMRWLASLGFAESRDAIDAGRAVDGDPEIAPRIDWRSGREEDR
jgi:Ca2+-binding RTX toxin-like protein